MRIVSIMWQSYLNMLVRASRNVGDLVELKAYSSKRLEEEPERLESVLEEAARADIILLYRSTEGFWETVEGRLRELGKKVPIVCLGHDPSYWMLSTVKPEIVAKAYSYLVINGEENFTNMLRYIVREVAGLDVKVEEPKPVPWEGLYHPDAPKIFSNVEEYLEWYNLEVSGVFNPKFEIRNSKFEIPMVGILFSRHYWVNDNLEVEDALIRELEALGLGVISAFSYSVKDEERGCKGSGEVVCEYFLNDDKTPRIDAFIKLQNFFLSNTTGKDFDNKEVASGGVQILKRLNVPVFSPVTSYYRTIEEWKNDKEGLGSGIGWSIAMPEFEGVIEPFIIGGASNVEGDLQRRMPIEERCRKVARRIANWIKLRQKPVAERKVGFILHNNPCASVEATVGGGAHLDTIESVSRIMHRMKETGYNVDPPADGKEMIETIMSRKAISEFRWTTTDEIVKKGGVLKQVTKEEYSEWFDTLSPAVKERMNNAWGKPPGEELNGVPAAMVYDGKILVTGVQYGNAVVCVQPKRGCAGARCDGQVCKILHDPDIPPPHQYMATYRYLERDFPVDVLVHVGTHGNLEFLPGKGTALSGDCYPDIAIGDIPHLYIYNADNPAEGTIAKRRSYATLIDHMQTVMTQGGLYEELEELGRFLGEYEQLKDLDPGRAHVLQHLIMEAIRKTNLDKEIKICHRGTEDTEKRIKLSDISDEEVHSLPFDEIAHGAHGALSRTRNTQIQDGMHIFGQFPEGEKRVDFINSILCYDAGEDVSLRKIVAAMIGMNLADMLADGGKVCPHHKQSYGELLEEVGELSKGFIRYFLTGDGIPVEELARDIVGDRLKNPEYAHHLEQVKERLADLNRRIDESQEIQALLHGFDGGYIPPGPSGLITRGRDDILPTGRNFYSLDPHRIPTKAAWRVGQKLAEAVIEKHKQEEGKMPENVAIYWQCTDIMWADGEGMAQIFYLLGVKPVWQPNGRVKGFEVIPLAELGRPRIDVTIRVSGITRDNFPNCIELVDETIQAVVSLPEPIEMNFVRKHSLAQIAEAGESEENKGAWRNATLRVFASKPGTYQAGTQLAVYASAWKDEADLSDVFVFWNGYAYGKGIFGEEKHKQLTENLKTVDITYNKVVSDEYDLFGCCCYFGTHGGMTAAARHISGKPVKTYYGDTREPEHVEVRDMADEVRRVVRTKLLNPKWIEGMKRHGYKGAGDISKRIGRVYGWEATTQEVDDWIFDDITSTFILDEENRKFFEKNNPWALEEIGRRLLEAHQRGLWNADPEILEGLKNAYLECEGWIEEKMGDVTGDFQGGSIDILTADDVADWGAKMQEIKEKLGG
ncbi:cobalt chelatase [Candidatus Desantisbacteria bacterium CG_4_10_14_3_um_filter_40_18]|uniref:Cobalt chelatase n=1 Tax=Candidatus Desantisbacteria bacterium CG_4_10_14_3_um_filter_40_18 TaxID=1974544 RepID=A0A2M7NZR2_9BACT|nr:MAG: cobalt chelatase [Candidatus Desantisbacteria bacterium CG_4_10_14_3_um_filter_40_18]